MERNSERSTGLEWENLALYGGKPIENPQQLGFSMYSSSSSGFYFNNNNDGGSYSSIFSAKNANASSAEPMTIGLRLGEERENRDSFYSSKTSIPIATTAMRVSRLSMQNPCCQVEGCHVDLTSAKDYHRRHRICESHSKSPKVVVAGMERRFCQQCSRFHDLAEFDDKKRSCRRRLSVHNARRRRLQPESAHLSSGLSSALYDRRPPNLLLNGISVSVANPTWDNAGSSTMRQIGDTLNRPSNPVGIGRTNTLYFSNNEIPNSISSIQTSNPQGLSVPATISPTVPDLPSAHSLLSPTSWSIHEAESRSMENLLVHGNYNSVSREHYQSGYMQAKQPEHSLNIHTAAAGPSQMQEFQLFKASYESDCFYSSQRNL